MVFQECQGLGGYYFLWNLEHICPFLWREPCVGVETGKSDYVCSIKGRQREDPKITFPFGGSERGIR